MLLHVNKNIPGSPLGGIHWHVSETDRDEYYTADVALNALQRLQLEVIPRLSCHCRSEQPALVSRRLRATNDSP